MICVKVKAALGIAKILGGREQEICLPEASRLANLLEVLEKKYGKLLIDYLYLDKDMKLRPEVQLLLNGRNIIFLDGLNTKLNDGDELFLLPLMGGG